jgi:hypothetical protein
VKDMELRNDIPLEKSYKLHNGIYYDLKEGNIYYDVEDIYGYMFGDGIISKVLLEVDSEYGLKSDLEMQAHIDKYRNRYITKITSLNGDELDLGGKSVIIEFTNGRAILIEIPGNGDITEYK